MVFIQNVNYWRMLKHKVMVRIRDVFRVLWCKALFQCINRISDTSRHELAFIA